MTIKYSKVTIRESQLEKKVRISSDIKPAIISSLIDKWQALIDMVAKTIDVPSGLIMKLNESTIEVFLKSETKGNPYVVGEEAKLIYGLYCETVIGTQNKLLVPDARKSPIWKDNNPDIDINMVSYLGYPINWPDGVIFGTVCVLDSKENHYNQNYFELLNQTKRHIETDLQLLISKQQVEEQNKQLEELNTTKDKFFSIISHDLRSPFAAILGFSDMLLRDHTQFSNEELEKHITSIIQSANKAYELLENLLEWSSIQTGAISYVPELLSVEKIILEAVSQSQSIANNKGIILAYNIADNIEVYADTLMINTVLRNLIINAIKFTHKNGGIKIIATQDKNNIMISVEDNGIGMNKETIRKIFKIGEYTSTKGTNNEGGTGLGLALCKEFIEIHGGEIWAESKVGKGSVFRFTLPKNKKDV